MPDGSIYAGIAASVTFIIGLIAHAMKLTWKVSKLDAEIRQELREEFDAQLDNMQRDIKKLEDEAMDIYRRQVGETNAAIRQKIHDVETWNRDTFVRKDSFETVVGRIEKSLEKLGDRFEEKMEKILERAASYKKD